MEGLSGKQLGPYQIISRLGTGGMATVFKAYQPRMDRYVALKILPRHFSKIPDFIHRFSQESRLIAKLEHPHILPVYDFGESDGYTYLVMRLIEGGSLSDLLKKHGKLELSRINSIISQMGGALDYAHKKGVIHRDVKPSNVLIDKFDNCLLTDFGIAKLVEATSHLTQTGGILGTPNYISPEQGSGKPIDARSDIYTLGIVLYQMVVGDVPYKADTPMAVIFKHIQDPLPLPRQQVPDLPEPVERVVLKALAKNPNDRYATAADLVNALQSAIAQPITQIPITKTSIYKEELQTVSLEKTRLETVKSEEVEKKKILPGHKEKVRTRRGWVYGVVAIFLLAMFAGAGWQYYNNMFLSEPILKVDTNPTSADVYVDGGHIGISPVQIEELNPGTHQILIKKDRYQDYKEYRFIQKDKPTVIQAKLVPKPFGDLEVNSNPSGAEVIIDDGKRGITPIAVKDLLKGTHRLMVKKEGFDPWQDTIEIISQEKAQISANLITIYGGLNISSSPVEADVYVDGKKEGKTPLVLKKVKKGKQKLEIKKTGFDVWEKDVDIKSAEVSQVHVDLVTIHGGLDISSNPSEAIVYIDEKEVGKTPLVLKDVQKGRRIIKLKKVDFDVWNREVYIKTAEVSKIKVDLVPSYGALKVLSTPNGAEVIIGGISKGKTPLLIGKVKKGTAKIEIKKKGYQEKILSVSLESGEEKTLDISLDLEQKQIEEEKKNLAHVDTKENFIRDSKNKYRLAIFPWRIITPRNINASVVQDCCIETIYRVAKQSDQIGLEYSYYEHKNYRNGVEVIKNINDKDLTQIWFRKSTFSNVELDINKVIGYGRKINTDLVFVIFADDPGIYTFEKRGIVYLIDINNKDLYKKYVQMSLCPNSNIEEAAEKLISLFLDKERKRGSEHP